MKNSKFLSIIFFLIMLFNIDLTAQPWKKHGKLQVVSANPHYLEYSDGNPFLWFGDTGWEMIKCLNRDEVLLYLNNRKTKGFNVIQTVIISEFIQSDKATNYYADSIFVNENPEKPMVTAGNNPDNPVEYDYWDHADYVVKTAENMGLYIALVPTWGEWVIPRGGKPLFYTTSQAYNYGWFVGNRYKNSPNIVWVLGGDRQPDERKEGVELWRAMAEGIADGVNGTKSLDGKADYTTTLMTHHAYNSSSNWFYNDAWIDLHLWGSYHADVNLSRSYQLAANDWNLPIPKPTINAEPCYEDHGINYAIEDNGVFTSTDVRVAAYWSLFSGTAGFTYGAHAVWQFTDSIRPKKSKLTFRTWQQSLNLPGSYQVIHLKRLMESRPVKGLIPDQSMITDGMGTCADYVAAIRGQSHAFVYIPTGNAIKIKMGVLSGNKIKAWWFDPRTGSSTLIGEYNNSGVQSFNVPGMSKELDWLRSGRGCDWVLVLDDAAKNYNEPGK